MNKKTFIIVILLAVLISAIIIFSSKSLDKKEINNTSVDIGVIDFLTGGQASLGEEVRNSLILANENITSDKKINLLIEDSKDDPKEALGIYNNFKVKKVPVIISTGDQVNYALSPVANADKIPLLMTVTAATPVSGDYVFRSFITAKQQAEIMGKYSYNTLNYNKPALLYVNNIFGEVYKTTLEQTLKAGNVSLSSSESFGVADMDMKTQITKIISQKPDVIFVGGFGPSYTVIFNQIRQLGWKGDILTVNTLAVPYFFNSITKENRHNIYFTDTAFSLDKPTNEKMMNFIKSYKERFNSDPSFIGAFSYDLYSVLVDVVNGCDTDSKSIIKCLSKSKNKSGVMGNIGFENQEMSIPLYVKKIVDGSVKDIQEIQ